jgi:hypothetical protein
MGGFDTHVGQVDGNNPALGMHATLLKYLADAVSAFQYDLTQLDQAGPKVSDRVLGFTISEFGRRPSENGSYGTDHGAASVQFVFGKQVNSVVIGQAPDLAHLDNNNDLRFQYDYRQVYLTLLTDWFGMSLPDARTVLQDVNGNIVPLDLIKPQTGSVRRAPSSGLSLSVYPNPLVSQATVALVLPTDSYLQLELVSMDGKRVQSVMERSLAAGSYNVPLSTEFPSGAYMLSMRTASERVTRLVHIVR